HREPTSDICFSQAEDGIRDRNVTGVQTCALPISRKALKKLQKRKADHRSTSNMLKRMQKEPSLEHIREREDMDAEEDDLVAGHAPVQLSVLITVTGGDPMELEANCDRLLQRAVESSCELRPLMLEQDTGFLAAALPFAWAD